RLRRVRQDRNSTVAEQAAFASLDHITGRAYYELDTNGKFVVTSMNLNTEVSPIASGATANAWVTPASDKIAFITATATYKTITRSVRSYVVAKEVGIWNNAI